MSKKIDTSDVEALTLEELKYLSDRGQLTDEMREHRDTLLAEEDDSEWKSSDGNTSDQNAAAEAEEAEREAAEAEAEAARLAEEAAVSALPMSGGSDAPTLLYGDALDGLDKDALKDQASLRNISFGGTASAILKRIQRHDAAEAK